MLEKTAHILRTRILPCCQSCTLACCSYACHCLQTGRAQDGSDEDDNTEPTHQSPWELFDEGLDAQQAVQEGPALDSPLSDRLKHAVQALSASEHFELFVDLLDPDAAYPASDTGGTLPSSAVLCDAVLPAMSLILLPCHTFHHVALTFVGRRSRRDCSCPQVNTSWDRAGKTFRAAVMWPILLEHHGQHDVLSGS